MASSKLLLGVVVGAMLLMVQCAGIGATIWSQLPDMNLGLNYSSEVKVPSLVADDWHAINTLPVTDIHWWGSYWVPNVPVPPDGTYYSDSLPDANAGGIVSFTLTMYSDIPAGVGVPFSRPGQQLWTKSVSAYNEAAFGTTTGGHAVYQYDVFLGQADWFQPVQGQIYWLSIQANLADPLRQWGWHEAASHFNDAAVQDFKGSSWVALENNQYKNDMAFNLTTIPEPGTLIALGSGLIGLVGFGLRRRRS